MFGMNGQVHVGAHACPRQGLIQESSPIAGPERRQMLDLTRFVSIPRLRHLQILAGCWVTVELVKNRE
jgi:hypothetical protein